MMGRSRLERRRADVCTRRPDDREGRVAPCRWQPYEPRRRGIERAEPERQGDEEAVEHWRWKWRLLLPELYGKGAEEECDAVEIIERRGGPRKPPGLALPTLAEDDGFLEEKSSRKSKRGGKSQRGSVIGSLFGRRNRSRGDVC